MKLHIMASMRTHFTLNDEEVHASPENYRTFWAKVSDASESLNKTGLGKICFAHREQQRNCELSRFRSVETDSLSRPLHIILVQLKPGDKVLGTVWEDIKAEFADKADRLDQAQLLTESINVRIYNNCVAMLQADINIDEFVNKQPANSIAEDFDSLQEFAVRLGEKLAQRIYHDRLYDFLRALVSCKNGRIFLSAVHFEHQFAHDNAILTENSEAATQLIRVNWVTRTLLVDSDSENNLAAIIDHWLKDCGDQDLIKLAKDKPDAYAVRWLNYLFRENSWSWKTMKAERKSGKLPDYTEPFADEWQAMLNAQYYYATFEALNDSLTSILAHSSRKHAGGQRSISALRELSRDLERHMITANLAMLEYHNNYGYYKRDVGINMKKIMQGWDFDEAILNEIERKTKSCEQRIDELHKKADSRSGFYSDLLLLGIALISVSAFLFQLIDYGRTMSQNADLAVYESNSWNLIKFISERPTDFIITLSLALIVMLFSLYVWFRRLKIMD